MIIIDHVYLNGQFVPCNEAAVSVEDRGFLFGDGVYEVIAIHKGFMVDGFPHLKRLERSMHELEITPPLPSNDIVRLIHELRQLNNVENGLIYIQVTRGVAPRVHHFPQPPVEPTFLVMTSVIEYPQPAEIAFKPCHVITLPDIRWGRCDIKSISLLANCVAREQARKADAFEAVMYDQDGYVTECSAANAWIINQRGELQTRQSDYGILNGICRQMALELIEKEDLVLREEPFSVEEMKQAKEVFLTTTTPMIKPIGLVDDVTINNGEIGPLTRKLLTSYRDRVFKINCDT